MIKLVNIKTVSIYPFSKENFESLIDFYFIKNGYRNYQIKEEQSKEDVIDKLYNSAKLIELDEFNFILSCLFIKFNGNYKFIAHYYLNEEKITIENIIKYGMDAYLCKDASSFSGGRMAIHKLVCDAIIKKSFSYNEYIQSL
jgi:hypothetical protein